MLRSSFQTTQSQTRRQCSAHRQRCVIVCQARPCAHQAQQQTVDMSRRGLVAGTLTSALAMGLSLPGRAQAEALGFDAVRALLRPQDANAVEATVIMMDASSVLRDIASLASTAQDSQERFEARKLWPGFAKRLRDVGPAAPIIAALVTGAKDSEATLSETYGGKSQEPGVTDALYISLGYVLTISGRTIKPEAQASPGPAQDAKKAIDDLLAKVPRDIYDQAQQFRVQRAAAYASKK